MRPDRKPGRVAATVRRMTRTRLARRAGYTLLAVWLLAAAGFYGWLLLTAGIGPY